MGVIKYASKWDLKSQSWTEPTKVSKPRSFGVATHMSDYDIIKNSKDRGINYIFVCYGTRIEDSSKASKKISNNTFYINKMVKFFKENSENNYVIRFVMLDADAPLIEDARKLAGFIDELAKGKDTSSINIIGHSKCGAMNMYIPSFYKNPRSLALTNLYNVSTPYVGTLIASPLIFYPEVKKLVVTRFGKNKLSDSIYESLIKFYESICSNSHMDYDIAKKDGVPEEKSDRYDKYFVQEMFSKENIEAINKVGGFYNFTTKFSKDTIPEALSKADYITVGLNLLDKWFFDCESDGFVKTYEQRIVEEHLDVSSVNLSASHFLYNNDEYKKVFECIDNTVENSFQRTR